MRLEKISPSALSTFKDCPLHFKLRYHDRIPFNRTFPWTEFGNWLHKGFDLSIKEGIPIEESLKQVINNYKFDNKYLERVPQILRHFKKFNSQLNPGKTEVEYRISIPDIPIPLTGIIDRLIQEPEKVLVVDYKTGKIQKTEKELKNDPQALFYTYAAHRLTELNYKAIRIVLCYLLSGDMISISFSVEEIEIFLKALRKQIELIQKMPPEAARPRPGKPCFWCEYNDTCPHSKSGYR